MDSDDTRGIPPGRGPKGKGSLYGDELAPGALAGEYSIQGTMAKGGCGTVYSAHHRLLGRMAAVKVLHRELASASEMVQRFFLEARAVNLIRHPNIVDIYEIGWLTDGRPFYVMEFLDGWNLDNFLKRHGVFQPAEAIELFDPICEALQAAHQAGIVHRDLKASNIFICRPDSDLQVKLLDFGIAKLMRPEPGARGITTANQRLGTPFAMAPEQIRGGPVDPRTDVYALGVLLYYLLTGRYPFMASEPIAIERMHLEEPPPRPSQFAPVWPSIDSVVLRAMEKEADKRYASALAFQTGLREAARPETASVRNLSSAVSCMAVAVFVDIQVADDAQEQMDDRLLDDLAQALDLAECELRSAGLLLPVETGNSLLGVRLLNSDAGQWRRERQQAIELAVTLWRMLAARSSADGRIHINICVHVDKAIARTSAHGTEIVGGPLVRIGTWAPPEPVQEVCVTPEALEGLDCFATRASSSRYLLVESA